MAYTNDMQTLADISGSSAAAMQAGIQNDAANQEQQIKNQVAQGTMQADIAKPSLQNMYTQAQTSTQQAIGQQEQQKAQLGQATLPGAISEKGASQQANISADQAKSLGTVGPMLGQVAGMLESVPQAARPAAMAQIGQKYNIDLSQFPQEIQNGNPDVLRAIGQKATQASAAYQEQLLKGGQEFQRAVTTTGQLVGGRQGVAETNQAAKQYVADRLEETRKALAPGMNILSQRIANHTATPDDITIYNAMQNQAQMVRGGQPFAAGITKTPVQGNVPGIPTSMGTQGGGDGQQAPVNNPPALQKAVEAAGQKYDPDHFDYRLGPNGTVQYKAK